MKVNKKCPKCQSENIIIHPKQHSKMINYNSLVVDSFHNARVERYICKNCGFFEEYIIKEDLKKFG